MRLLVCAGGTGGGVYPALAVLKAWPASDNDPLDVLWVGGEGGMEAGLVARADLPYESIPAAQVHGVGWRRLPVSALQIGRGVVAARRILTRFRPQVIFFTGGFVAVPMALAAQLVRPKPKILLYVPDIEPGLALQTLSRFADQIAVTAPGTDFNYPKPVRVTGYPIRADLTSWERAQAQQELGLDTNLLTVLIFGGSKGARSINQATWAALPGLLPLAQIVHITGEANWDAVEAVRNSLPADLAGRYHAYPYLHAGMGAALAAADLAVSRAGASALGEYPAFGLPAILVPYPYTWQYQKVNADFLVQRGAARMLRDEELDTRLLEEIRILLQNEPMRQEMRQAMRNLATPQAARSIADLAIRLADGGTA